MLDLEVQPERSLGNEQWEFLLGMPFYQVVQVLKKQDMTIKGVQVWYSDQNPLMTDLVITLTQDGIRLIFDSDTQQLRIIEVFNMQRVKLRYCGNVFNSTNVMPTLPQIDQSFGATHPGDYDDKKHLFILNFRGLSFEFRVDSKSEARVACGLGSLQYSPSLPPMVTRLFIYTGHCLEDTKPPSLPLNCLHGNVFLEHIDCLSKNGVPNALKFFLIAEGNGPAKLSEIRKVVHERIVTFGDTCQDVFSALGCPNKVFHKELDKMKIHSTGARKTVQSKRSDFFFNYFTLGVDILFDAYTQRVKKFILHTNFPGHFDFNMFYRCKFIIPLSAIKLDHEKSSMTDVSSRSIDICYNTKWHDIEDYVIHPRRTPIVLNRASSTNTTNPFGRTYCHGVSNMIFEIMQNDHIASITIYQPKSSVNT